MLHLGLKYAYFLRISPRRKYLDLLLTNSSPQFAKYMILGGPMAKNMPAVQETWVQSLGGKDPLQ